MSGIFDQVINYAPPSLLTGTVTYEGTWSAATNTPTLPNPPSSVTNGHYYVVSAGGTQFSLVFNIGDWIISNGSAWEKVDNTDAVDSVFGRTGAVVGVSTDYSAVGITNTALGASNPSTVAATTITATSTVAATGAVTGSNLSGTNTGDQTITLTGGVTGSGTGSFAATVVTNANLTGDVTSSGNATTLTNAPVIAKVLTGYTSGAGTVAATDSILQAIQKLNGNDGTNANLTGVITSSGNATSIASQTGTGTKFVVDTSPTLVTPNIGVATGTSLAAALNGSLGATTPSTIAATTIVGSGSAIFGNTSTPSFSVGGTQINNPASVGPSIFSQAAATGNRWIDFMGSSTTVASLNNNSGVFSIAASASGAEINVSGTQRGLFSSTGLSVTGTLGVTGVATLGNGAILGTPASGTVTNLTGTASININGTVGATTAAAGSFTTVAATASGTPAAFTKNSDGIIQTLTRASVSEWRFNIANSDPFGGQAGSLAIYPGNASVDFIIGRSNGTTANLKITDANGNAAFAGTLSATGLLLGGSSLTSFGVFGSLPFQQQSDISDLGLGTYINNSSSASGIIFAKSRNATLGSHTIVQDGDRLGQIEAMGSDGAAFARAAAIRFEVDGTPGASADMPGRILFFTSADGSATLTERMRISAAGVVSITGTLSATADVKAAVYGYFGSSGVAPSASNPGFAFSNPFNVSAASWSAGTATTSLTLVNVYNGNGIVGTVVTNGSGTAWNTSSDARLKTNLRDITDSSVIIDALKPRRFDWLTFTKEKDDYGFVAQEAYEVYPKMVTVGGDDPAEKPWGMDASKLIPVLVAELQSLRKRLAALESK